MDSFAVPGPKGPGDPVPGRADPKVRAEGPERHLDAARQKLPRDNFCRSIAAQLTTGTILKEEKMSSIVGERQFGRHFRRRFGRG